MSRRTTLVRAVLRVAVFIMIFPVAGHAPAADGLFLEVRGAKTMLFEAKCQTLQADGRSAVVQYHAQPFYRERLNGKSAACTVRKLGAGAGIRVRLIQNGRAAVELDLPRHYQKGRLRTDGPWGKARSFRHFPTLFGRTGLHSPAGKQLTVPLMSGGEKLLPTLRR